MTVKSVQTPDGRTFHFGRRAPTVRHPHLQLRHYMPKLPAPPASIDYSPQASAALAQMYGNDQLGDCVIAAVAHAIGAMTGNAGIALGGLVLPETEITQLYSTCCGYVPGHPSTDQGCDIQTVLNYWKSPGVNDPDLPIAPHTITGVLGVDPTNVNEIQTAIWLFENLIFGVGLPDAWISPFPSTSGFTWDVAGPADLQNGHCFPGLSYNSAAVLISTWAMTGYITYPAIAEYAAANAQGELYVVVSQDLINRKSEVSPAGLDWAQLQADFAALGGGTPPTPPPTPPTPPPTPPTPPVPPGPPPLISPPDPNALATWLGQYYAYLASTGV